MSIGIVADETGEQVATKISDAINGALRPTVQAWFTDAAAGATGANLSNAVTVTFCP